jgi:ABC-2 type transport system permease protein
VTDALRYEWMRLRTIRSTYWILGVALVFQIALSFLIAWQLPESGPLAGGENAFSILVTVGASLGVAPLAIAYVLGLLGVFSMGHEYRHGMIRATLSALPSRATVLAAKVVTTSAVALVGALLCFAAAVAASLTFGVGLPEVGVMAEIALGTTVFTILFALSGLAYATITRNQTAAVALLLLVPTLVEGLIKAVVLAVKAASDDPSSPEGLVRVLAYLPYDAGGQMYTRISLDDALQFFGVEPFGPLGGGVVMRVFVAGLLALATALFLRRDA